ncbi:MAG: hypothetical protein C4531_10310 [Desulfurivibrio sp.]|jgi:flagellar M-ring protein FliF|nr:MAG: hypothetical protein C4531_10310 [Desulfurivibrio sp.]
MEKFDTIARIAEWLALPLTYLILLVLFLFFMVRPFFSYLFNWNRIHALKTLQEAQQKKEEAQRAAAAREEQAAAEEDESFVPPPPDRGDERRIMNKLAESDPEKAGDLVKQWLRKDQRES